MSMHPVAAIAIATLALAIAAGTAVAGEACYRKVASPPVYQMLSEPVMLAPSHVVTRQLPGEYQQVSEQILVRPAQVVARHAPAVSQTVAEQVLVSPGRRKWSVTRDAAGNEIGCWVNTPPVYVTHYRTVMMQTASMQYETIPAEYRTVTRTVMVRPPGVTQEVAPAVYATRTREVLVQPASFGWEPLGGCYR